jgi:hypothetical protein
MSVQLVVFLVKIDWSVVAIFLTSLMLATTNYVQIIYYSTPSLTILWENQLIVNTADRNMKNSCKIVIEKRGRGFFHIAF